HLEQKNPIIYLQLHGDSNTCDSRKQTMFGFWILRQAKNSKSPVWNEKFEFSFDRQPTERILLSLHVKGSSWLRSHFGRNTFHISENYIYISLADVMDKIYINEDYGLMKSMIAFMDCDNKQTSTLINFSYLFVHYFNHDFSKRLLIS
nr:hypothetical protein [Tanacetum cinerariifolium]